MRPREFATLTTPSIIVMFGLLIVPLVQTVRWSFERVRYGQPGTFIGLDNYTSALTDPRMGRAAAFTVGITVAVTITLLVGGYVLAVMVNTLKRMRPVVLGILLVSYVVPGIVGFTMISWLFDDNFGGVANQVITALGGPEVLWFVQAWPNRLLVVAATVWQLLPFAMLIILAALQGVPEETLEAARMDGAGTLRTHWSVIVPTIRGLLGFVALISIMDVLRTFDALIPLSPQAVQLGNESVQLYVYNKAFLNGGQQLGLGSAMNVLLIVLIVVMLAPFIRQTIRDGKTA